MGGKSLAILGWFAWKGYYDHLMTLNSPHVFQIYFSRMVTVYKQAIEAKIDKITPKDYSRNEEIYHMSLFLQRLYEVNEVEKILSFPDFYLQNLPKGGENLFEDYKIWQINQRKYGSNALEKMSFCLFPFFYDAQSKAALMRLESQITQVTQMQRAQERNLASIAHFFTTGSGGGFRMPHLTLEVSRENIVHDTVHQIERIIY